MNYKKRNEKEFEKFEKKLNDKSLKKIIIGPGSPNRIELININFTKNNVFYDMNKIFNNIITERKRKNDHIIDFYNKNKNIFLVEIIEVL